MTEIEQKIKELEQTIKSHEENIEELSKEIEDLKKQLEKERARNKYLKDSKDYSNKRLIDSNNKYAESYEDKYIEVIDRLAEIEKMLK